MRGGRRWYSCHLCHFCRSRDQTVWQPNELFGRLACFLFPRLRSLYQGAVLLMREAFRRRERQGDQCVKGAHGTPMVHLWRTCATSTMHSWCTHGALVLYPRCTHGTRMAHLWSTHGTSITPEIADQSSLRQQREVTPAAGGHAGGGRLRQRREVTTAAGCTRRMRRRPR